jgi:hypothetical protein
MHLPSNLSAICRLAGGQRVPSWADATGLLLHHFEIRGAEMKKFLLTGTALALVLGATAARADTFTLTGSLGEKYALDTTNVGGGVFDVFLTIDTTALPTTDVLGDVAIKVASGDNNLTFISAPAGYTLVDGGLNNGGCSGSGAGFFCFSGSVNAGGVYVFEASIKDTPDSTGSIKDQFFNAAGSKIEQLSEDTTVGTHVPSAAPEPSSLMLLGTGALGLAGAVRRKFRS